MSKKILLILLPVLLLFGGLILLVSVMVSIDFFGEVSSDTGYVEGNIEYASEYLSILNQNIARNLNGYIPLSRLLYFYKEDDSLRLKDIYSNNLDEESKNIKPISEVCQKYYKTLSICKEDLDQSNDSLYKPFSFPIDFKKTSITSFFGQERIVYEKSDIHYAWDFAAASKTPVYSVYDGVVKTVRFNQFNNDIDTSNGAGNYIVIEYNIDDVIYNALYGHLYPYSTKVMVGQKVYQGDEIASVGMTGYATGNHLHWQVSRDGKLIDGMNLVDFSYDLVSS